MNIGLDIGGTKIAGAAFDAEGVELVQIAFATPNTYAALLETCRTLVEQLELKCGRADSVGVCAPYADADTCANVPCLIGKNARQDLEKLLHRPTPFGNDANCAALAEAIEGAGRGYRAVFSLIMGTGIGGGFVLNGHVLAGANGLCGEMGHLPLPHYEESDGELVSCGCGQTGCIEKLIAGEALARLYQSLTGKSADAKQIAEQARQRNTEALHVLDRYYTTVAKAMTAILHMFDPDIITVSGGLNTLPGLYTEVPKRWGKYAICKNPVTKFVPAAFGARAGLRGAALLGINS
jgi:fructokinase